MASKIPEEPPNTESGETLAIRMKKKRSRRVSFADTEITSVHIFNRDEDYDTPPNSKPSSRNDNGDLDPDNMVIGFFKDLGGDSEDSGDDEGIADARKSFLRPIGSPSPGSSTAGSVTSNDEDNFFGPVSASFIRPEQLSDSAASYDKYEDTMDTTAFSMHYRSLVRSESGEEPKTPTAVSLAFEEKTPTRNPTDSGSLMEITEPKKLTSQSLVPDGEVRGGEDSNDMSIVEKNPNKYDYGRLSPTIDALLAEGSKDLHTESATFIQNEASHIGQRNGELGNFGSHEMSAEAASAAGVKLRELNGGCLDQIAYDCLSNRNSGLAAAASTGHQIQSPNQLIRGNKEFPKDAFEGGMSKLETVDNGNIQKVDIMDLQFDVRSQHESAYQHLSEGSVIENSPKEGRHESDIDQNFDRQYASPLEGSLLSFWGQQSILNTPKSARHLDMISSSSKQLGFLLSREHLKPNESISSIQKSISRLRIPNPSPSVSSLKEGIDKLKCRLSSYSSMAFTDVLAENSKDLESKYVGAPVACLEEKLSSANLENQEYESIFVNIDSNGIEAPQSTGKLGLNKEITGLEEDGEPLDYMVMGILSKDKATKPVIGVGSPSNMALSGRKVMQHILMSEISPKRTLVTFGTDSSSVNNGKANPHYLQVKSETVGTGQSPSRDTTIMNFQLESSEKNLKTGADPMLSESYISGSTPELSALKSPTYKESTQSPLRTEPTQSSSSQIFGQMAALKEPALTSPMKWPTQSPSRKEPTRSSPRIEPIRSSPQKDLSQSTSRRELAWTPLRNEPTKSPSIKEPTKKSPRKESTKNPSRLGPSHPVHSDIMQSFARKDVPSPKSNSKTLSNEDCHQELHISRSPFFSQNTEISSERKRSIGVALDDVCHIDKIPRFQRSPDIHRSGNFGSELILHHSDQIYNEREKIEGDTALVHWSDFLVKFSKVTQQLLSPSINKLNFSAIGLLEDILVHLLKVRKYEMLGSEIQSQRVSDCFNIRHKRVAETRLLLYKIAYEKAKLQLMGVKHENLQKRVQLLSSGIQECHMLKLNYIQRSESGTSDTHHQSCSVNFESEHQVVCDKISTMKQEIKVLDTKIKSLNNFFHCYCKLKGEPSCTDTIAFVQDHVKTRTCCRLLRQDLQLWQVVDFETRDGQYTVLLDYQGYLSQRFTLNSGPVSSFVISNELNDLNIVKNFPNMDARVAFQFVLNTEATRRGVSSKFFMQETQVVRSLLCNLLDVIHELQMAQIEIVNLTQTSFHSPSVEQLNLQLCFINFNSGRKVTLTLDLTCLNRGVYPSEILPHQVQDRTGGSQKLESEIKAAAGKLEVGFLRILRLCKCISQAMQATSK